MQTVEELSPSIGIVRTCAALGIPRASFYRRWAASPEAWRRAWHFIEKGTPIEDSGRATLPHDVDWTKHQPPRVFSERIQDYSDKSVGIFSTQNRREIPRESKDESRSESAAFLNSTFFVFGSLGNAELNQRSSMCWAFFEQLRCQGPVQKPISSICTVEGW